MRFTFKKIIFEKPITKKKLAKKGCPNSAYTAGQIFEKGFFTMPRLCLKKKTGSFFYLFEILAIWVTLF